MLQFPARNFHSGLRTAYLMIASISFIPQGQAINIAGDDGNDYDAARHARFYQGIDKAFIGEPLKMSGITKLFNTQVNPAGSGTWATMISESYFIAGHVLPIAGHEAIFYRTDSLNSTDIWKGTVVSSTNQFICATSDSVSYGLSIGQLVGSSGYSATPPDWVRRYPLLSRPENVAYSNLDTVNKSLYIVGLDHDAPTELNRNAAVRVGRNDIDVATEKRIYFSASTIEYPNDETNTLGGDSGGPSMTLLPTVGSALTGIHWGVNMDASISGFIDDIVAVVPEPVTIVTDLAGDFNSDFRVDATDLGIIATHWEGTEKSYSQGDVNGDGVVDVSDLGVLATNFGKRVVTADFNSDVTVDGDDFEVIAQYWNDPPTTAYTNGDATGDGLVNVDDLEAFGAAWLASAVTRPSVTPIHFPGDVNGDGAVGYLDQYEFNNADEGPTGCDPFKCGDLDGDSDLDGADEIILEENLGNMYGDLTNDGVVNVSDAIVLVESLGESGSVEQGNLNGVGNIDENDFKILGFWWGYSPDPSLFMAVPEPVASSVWWLGIVICLSRHPVRSIHG